MQRHRCRQAVGRRYAAGSVPLYRYYFDNASTVAAIRRSGHDEGRAPGGLAAAATGFRFLNVPDMHVWRHDANDPIVWSGRASQEGFVDLSALRSCINVSGL